MRTWEGSGTNFAVDPFVGVVGLEREDFVIRNFQLADVELVGAADEDGRVVVGVDDVHGDGGDDVVS